MVLAVGALLPYLVDIAKGSTRPTLSSWLLFFVLNALQAVVALVNGAGWTALFSGALALGPLAVVVLSLYRRDYSRWQHIDTYCLLAALFGVFVWLTLDTPEGAVVVFILVSFVAMVPTLLHAWYEPQEETWQTFGINLLASSLAIVALTKYTFIALSIPLYVVMMSVVLMGIILSRRAWKQHAQQAR